LSDIVGPAQLAACLLRIAASDEELHPLRPALLVIVRQRNPLPASNGDQPPRLRKRGIEAPEMWAFRFDGAGSHDACRAWSSASILERSRPLVYVDL
jgi:hypothetical protein